MIINVVYKLTYENSTIEPLSLYTIENVAKQGVENYAKNMVKNMFGEFHLEKSLKYDYTIEDVESDNSIGEGYYLIKENNRIIVVYKYPTQLTKTVPKNVIRYITKKVVTPKKVTLSVLEKVKKTLKKQIKEEQSYLVSFISSPTIKEIEVEEEVDEIVEKEFSLYEENEVVEQVNEVEYTDVLVKGWITDSICEFYYTSIDISDYTQTNEPISNTVSTAEKKDNNIITSKILPTYLEEINEILKNIKYSGENIKPSDIKKQF